MYVYQRTDIYKCGCSYRTLPENKIGNYSTCKAKNYLNLKTYYEERLHRYLKFLITIKFYTNVPHVIFNILYGYNPP